MLLGHIAQTYRPPSLTARQRLTIWLTLLVALAVLHGFIWTIIGVGGRATLLVFVMIVLRPGFRPFWFKLGQFGWWCVGVQMATLVRAGQAGSP